MSARAVWPDESLLISEPLCGALFDVRLMFAVRRCAAR